MQEEKPEASEDVAALLDEGLTESEIAEINGAEDEASSDTEVEEKAEPQEESAKEQAKPPDGYVPHGALHAEREQHKQTRSELARLRQAQEVIAERLKAMPQASEPEKALPSPDDPIARLNQLYDWMEEQRTAGVQQQQQNQQQQARQETLDAADLEYRNAVASDASVETAYNALLESFNREYSVYNLPPQEAQKQMQAAVIEHVEYAQANGIPIGDYIKSLATARGWAPDNPTPSGPKSERQNKIKEAGSKIDKIAAAQDTHKTLSSGDGGEGEVTFETLSKMSGEALEQFAAQNPDLFDQLTGA